MRFRLRSPGLGYRDRGLRFPGLLADPRHEMGPCCVLVFQVFRFIRNYEAALFQGYKYRC